MSIQIEQSESNNQEDKNKTEPSLPLISVVPTALPEPSESTVTAPLAENISMDISKSNVDTTLSKDNANTALSKDSTNLSKDDTHPDLSNVMVVVPALAATLAGSKIDFEKIGNLLTDTGMLVKDDSNWPLGYYINYYRQSNNNRDRKILEESLMTFRMLFGDEIYHQNILGYAVLQVFKAYPRRFFQMLKDDKFTLDIMKLLEQAARYQNTHQEDWIFDQLRDRFYWGDTSMVLVTDDKNCHEIKRSARIALYQNDMTLPTLSLRISDQIYQVERAYAKWWYRHFFNADIENIASTS